LYEVPRRVHFAFNWIPPTLVAVHGHLYGMIEQGGAQHNGKIVEIMPNRTLRTIYSFIDNGVDGGMIWLNDRFYGTLTGGTGSYAYGIIFSLTRGGVESDLARVSAGSRGSLLAPVPYDGSLFVASSAGGNASCDPSFPTGCGLVYKVQLPNTATPSYTFNGKPDGAFPSGAPVVMNGSLYGTTSSGGNGPCGEASYQGCGTIYELTASGLESVVYSFGNGTDGEHPFALTAVNGSLFGFSLLRNSSSVDSGGVLFEFTPGASGS
ncbi:MAG TPA: choice-of-anchor tandem repeat GloVer-containing protein, partial [Candidatus Acidoferrales bacterium]|nr:choice-of-anchor tandem repeat GloVer-containing protein [Candidatus Acidoferrales bacterium]